MVPPEVLRFVMHILVNKKNHYRNTVYTFWSIWNLQRCATFGIVLYVSTLPMCVKGMLQVWTNTIALATSINAARLKESAGNPHLLLLTKLKKFETYKTLKTLTCLTYCLWLHTCDFTVLFGLAYIIINVPKDLTANIYLGALTLWPQPNEAWMCTAANTYVCQMLW